MRFIAVLFSLLSLSCAVVAQVQNDFRSWASTPPMGWNSYDCYGLSVTEKTVLESADYMSKHLLKYGWEYVVIDADWFNENGPDGFDYIAHDTIPIHYEYNMDGYGRLIPAVGKFPSSRNGKGLKPMIDQIHAKGLKFGLHIMRGLPKKASVEKCPVLDAPEYTADQFCEKKNACGWCNDSYQLKMDHPATQAYYNSVFALFAEWGVDFVKVDDISYPYQSKEIEIIRKAIDQCGRPIVLSLSPGEAPLTQGMHVASHANMWRIVGDLWDYWGAVKHLIFVSANWSPYIGNGTWPDCDMIPLGRLAVSQHPANGKERDTRLTPTEQRTLLTQMAIAKSPLMFGGDLTQMDDFTLSLLTNKDVLDVNQHSTGNRVAYIDTGKVMWLAESPSDNSYYIALFNATDSPISFPINLKDYGKSKSKKMKDLWNGETTKIKNDQLNIKLEAHEARLCRVW